MTFIQDRLIAATSSKKNDPSIQGWLKLFGRTTDPDGDCERSLRAEARDPLWFLTRQWQLGEFKAEDAGSPIFAGCKSNTWKIDAYRIREEEKPYNLNDAPLEPIIESENLLSLFSLEERYRQLDLIIQLSTQFNRLCAQLKIDPVYKAAYKEQYKLDLNENQVSALRNYPQDYQQYLNAKIRLFDGVELLLQIQDGTHKEWVRQEKTLSEISQENLLIAAEQLHKWFETLYFQPEKKDAWNMQRMEYAAAFSARLKSPHIEEQHHPPITLRTTLHNGDLDWFSFEQTGVNPPQKTLDRHKWLIPAPIRFKGMAASRYWELEDGTVNLFKMDAEPTDLAKLIWGEFSLLYNDDWFVVPYEMELGQIKNFSHRADGSDSDIHGFQVKDVFGFTHKLQDLTGPEFLDGGWQYLNISDEGNHTGDQVFMLPLAYKTEEGKPLEQIKLVRDEMSNLVWAIEKITPSPSGKGIPGDEIPNSVKKAAKKEELPRYVLGTPAPKNWIPFLPVALPGQAGKIAWQRARMPKNEEPGSHELNIYSGTLISGPSPFFINENEIPREGRLITRSFQRTRWLNGKTILWIGKRVETGTGESSGGLSFDQIV